MKYGILEYKNPNVINIGDGMQILSVLNLYRRIGIREEDLVRINYYDLQTYGKEEVILPICFPFYGYNRNNRITCFSPNIRPLFLALSLFDTKLEEDEISYLKKYEPIGCRDEFTADGLSQKGIRTYINGCMTLTLDIGKRNKTAEKVYCIDVPQRFKEEYVPASLKHKLVDGTSIYRDISMRSDECARSLLCKYAEQAELVITSRLHAAIPCFAVGIPVIFIHTEFSYRFSWMEEILPVYLPEEWEKVDWNGNRISTNAKALAIRKLMDEIACERLAGSDAARKIDKLQNIYGRREKRKYVRGPMEVAVQYMNTHWEGKNEVVEYVVWGLNQVAASLIDYIQEYYPQASCVAAIDAVKTKAFKGIVPQRIENADIKNKFVFVTADAVNPYALTCFKNIGKSPSEYLLLWKHINLSLDELEGVV